MTPAKKGFSLLEILIALVILTSGVALLANSWTSSYAKIRKAQVSTEVAALLERKMVEIDNEYRGKPLDSIPEEKSEDFGTEYPQYRWQMQSKAFEMPDLTAIFTARTGGANEMLLMIMKTLTEHLKKTVKEVKVTVFYKEGKKELKFSISTYFIDFNKEIAVGGVAQ